MPWYATQTRARLGAAYLLAGRLDDALPLLERTGELVNAGEADAQQASFLTFVAEGYLRSGRLDAAADMADRAFTLATTRGERANAAWARRMQAEIAAHRDRPDSQAAVAQLPGRPRRRPGAGDAPAPGPLPPRPRQAVPPLGRPDEARAELATAVAMLREMGMTFWLPEAEAELAATMPPSSRGSLGCEFHRHRAHRIIRAGSRRDPRAPAVSPHASASAGLGTPCRGGDRGRALRWAGRALADERPARQPERASIQQ